VAELVRQPLPPPDPVYAELQGAREYIASLEREVDALRGAVAKRSDAPGLLQRLRARLRN
jgi:hypothetical protein